MRPSIPVLMIKCFINCFLINGMARPLWCRLCQVRVWLVVSRSSSMVGADLWMFRASIVNQSMSLRLPEEVLLL